MRDTVTGKPSEKFLKALQTLSDDELAKHTNLYHIFKEVRASFPETGNLETYILYENTGPRFSEVLRGDDGHRTIKVREITSVQKDVVNKHLPENTTIDEAINYMLHGVVARAVAHLVHHHFRLDPKAKKQYEKITSWTSFEQVAKEINCLREQIIDADVVIKGYGKNLVVFRANDEELGHHQFETYGMLPRDLIKLTEPVKKPASFSDAFPELKIPEGMSFTYLNINDKVQKAYRMAYEVYLSKFDKNLEKQYLELCEKASLLPKIFFSSKKKYAELADEIESLRNRMAGIYLIMRGFGPELLNVLKHEEQTKSVNDRDRLRLTSKDVESILTYQHSKSI